MQKNTSIRSIAPVTFRYSLRKNTSMKMMSIRTMAITLLTLKSHMLTLLILSADVCKRFLSTGINLLLCKKNGYVCLSFCERQPQLKTVIPYPSIWVLRAQSRLDIPASGLPSGPWFFDPVCLSFPDRRSSCLLSRQLWP